MSAEDRDLFNTPPPSGRYFEAYRRKPTNFESILNFDHIKPHTRALLTRVYALLCATVVVCAMGVHASQFLPPSAQMVALVGCFVLIFVLGFSTTEQNVQWRVGCLLAFGGLSGIQIGPLVVSVARADPWLPLVAFALTAVVFTCFSLAALFSESRKYLFLNGTLSACLLGLVVVSLANIFLQWPVLTSLWLYGGLVLFSLFVIVDTQLILDRAESGSLDVVFAALDLFLDALNIFIRILIILSRNRGQNK